MKRESFIGLQEHISFDKMKEINELNSLYTAIKNHLSEAPKVRFLVTATAAKEIGLTGKDLPVGGKLFDSYKF